jgi:hypothetical protein
MENSRYCFAETDYHSFYSFVTEETSVVHQTFLQWANWLVKNHKHIQPFTQSDIAQQVNTYCEINAQIQPENNCFEKVCQQLGVQFYSVESSEWYNFLRQHKVHSVSVLESMFTFSCDTEWIKQSLLNNRIIEDKHIRVMVLNHKDYNLPFIVSVVCDTKRDYSHWFVDCKNMNENLPRHILSSCRVLTEYQCKSPCFIRLKNTNNSSESGEEIEVMVVCDLPNEHVLLQYKNQNKKQVFRVTHQSKMKQLMSEKLLNKLMFLFIESIDRNHSCILFRPTKIDLPVQSKNKFESVVDPNLFMIWNKGLQFHLLQSSESIGPTIADAVLSECSQQSMYQLTSSPYVIENDIPCYLFRLVPAFNEKAFLLSTCN